MSKPTRGPYIVVMPQLGQAMERGLVVEWLVDDGAVIAPGQRLLSVESDKAAYEIEAAAAGVLRRIAAVGEEVAVGAPLATIGDADAATLDTNVPVAASRSAPSGEPARIMADAPADARILASPRARARAAELRVDLSTVAAHRADGLIVAADVVAAHARRPLVSPRARAQASSLNVDLSAVQPHRSDGLVVAADVEAVACSQSPANRKPLTGLKRVAADRLARSWQQAPHIVQMIEVDATRLTAAIAAIRAGKLAVTLNDILIKIAADALARFPAINARFENDGVVANDDICVGLAVATDDGLTVPVVRRADRLSLTEVAAETRALIAAARDKKLAAKQLGRASVTISNLGRYGVAFGTPVLNLDEPALIFVGAIEERPVARNGQLVVRPMTTLSIAYDHRVVDGLQAAQFSQALKQGLETLDGVALDEAREHAQQSDGRTLTARSDGIAMTVHLRSPRHAWTVDESVSLGGQDSAPDPIMYTLGGLAACMVMALKSTAKRRRVPLERVDVQLEATPPHGKVKSVRLVLTAIGPAAPEEIEKLLAPAKATCYVHDLLRSDLDLTIELVGQRAR